MWKAINFYRGLLVLVTAALADLSWADSPYAPYPHVATTRNGRYYFKMIPNRSGSGGGSGTCFEVTADRADKVLWKTEGWYSFNVYLSLDGRYLIRMGPWPQGVRPSHAHLAVAFYESGKLLRKYSTQDLVLDGSAVVTTVSHYFWEKGLPVFDPSENRLQIVTQDDVQYVFDVTTGKIISKSAGKK